MHAKLNPRQLLLRNMLAAICIAAVTAGCSFSIGRPSAAPTITVTATTTVTATPLATSVKIPKLSHIPNGFRRYNDSLAFTTYTGTCQDKSFQDGWDCVIVKVKSSVSCNELKVRVSDFNGRNEVIGGDDLSLNNIAANQIASLETYYFDGDLPSATKVKKISCT